MINEAFMTYRADQKKKMPFKVTAPDKEVSELVQIEHNSSMLLELSNVRNSVNSYENVGRLNGFKAVNKEIK